MARGDRKRRKKAKKVKSGDGSALKPYRGWHVVYRSLFGIQLPLPTAAAGDPTGDRHPGDAEPARHRYQVDIDFFDWDWRVYLYRDGLQHAYSSTPAVFGVPGGVIEVRTSLWGVSRIHYVAEDESETVLRPEPRTAEWHRARFDRRFPTASRLIGWAAIAILLIALAVVIPQGIEQLTQIPWVAENLGTFTSPVSLPAWANTVLAVGGVLAAIERALSLRSHWLIDADTWFLGD